MHCPPRVSCVVSLAFALAHRTRHHTRAHTPSDTRSRATTGLIWGRGGGEPEAASAARTPATPCPLKPCPDRVFSVAVLAPPLKLTLLSCSPPSCARVARAAPSLPFPPAFGLHPPRTRTLLRLPLSTPSTHDTRTHAHPLTHSTRSLPDRIAPNSHFSRLRRRHRACKALSPQ